MPAAKEQRHRQAADGEHPQVFRQEKRGVFESGIFGHVMIDNFLHTIHDIM